MGGKPILAIDFDGTLHNYKGWNDGKMGFPNEGAVEFVKEAMPHFQIVVVSSRCNDPGGIEEIASWLDQYGFPQGLLVTDQRPPAYVSLDDRAMTFCGMWPQVRDLMAFDPWWKKDMLR